jgi:hypothetical protein
MEYAAFGDDSAGATNSPFESNSPERSFGGGWQMHVGGGLLLQYAASRYTVVAVWSTLIAYAICRR